MVKSVSKNLMKKKTNQKGGDPSEDAKNLICPADDEFNISENDKITTAIKLLGIFSINPENVKSYLESYDVNKTDLDKNYEISPNTYDYLKENIQKYINKQYDYINIQVENEKNEFSLIRKEFNIKENEKKKDNPSYKPKSITYEESEDIKDKKKYLLKLKDDLFKLIDDLKTLSERYNSQNQTNIINATEIYNNINNSIFKEFTFKNLVVEKVSLEKKPLTAKEKEEEEKRQKRVQDKIKKQQEEGEKIRKKKE